MAIWAWIQPVDRIWKVVTDLENGTVKVFDEKNDLMMEENGLSKEAVSLIENEFLDVIATRLMNNNQKHGNDTGNKKVSDYNPMYV